MFNATLQCQSRFTVDGGWSAWGEWGDCHVTCGDGTKMRQRICNWPEPQNGGNECHGQTTSVTSCTVIPACPQNGKGSGNRESYKNYN